MSRWFRLAAKRPCQVEERCRRPEVGGDEEVVGSLGNLAGGELADPQGRVTEGGENRAHQVDVGPVTADHHHQPSLSRRLATATHGSVAPHNAASPPGLRHVRATSAVLAPNDSRGCGRLAQSIVGMLASRIRRAAGPPWSPSPMKPTRILAPEMDLPATGQAPSICLPTRRRASYSCPVKIKDA